MYEYIAEKLAVNPYITLNCIDLKYSSPYILNISCKGISSAYMISFLAKRGIIVSSKSACLSSNSNISRVLMKIYSDYDIASSSLRISFNNSLDIIQLDHIIQSITEMIDKSMVKRRFL
ncbi:cysteine desulfurase [compost metagenome]